MAYRGRQGGRGGRGAKEDPFVPFPGSGGITVKKPSQAMIVGIYNEPLTARQCNMIVERLGDYLIDQGI